MKFQKNIIIFCLNNITYNVKIAISLGCNNYMFIFIYSKNMIKNMAKVSSSLKSYPCKRPNLKKKNLCRFQMFGRKTCNLFGDIFFGRILNKK